jgi:hypothetical protein
MTCVETNVGFSERSSLAATPTARLKTGAHELKLENNPGRAEFFALPTFNHKRPLPLYTPLL